MLYYLQYIQFYAYILVNHFNFLFLTVKLPPICSFVLVVQRWFSCMGVAAYAAQPRVVFMFLLSI
jgi:hypothetical protein